MIDNESAFLNAYKILYENKRSHRGARLIEIHEKYLKANCVFRRNTIKRLQVLVKSPDPSQLLLRYGNSVLALNLVLQIMIFQNKNVGY